MCVIFITQEEWEDDGHKQNYHTSWVTVVDPTDRPKSVHNRCIVELYVAFCVFTLLSMVVIIIDIWGS